MQEELKYMIYYMFVYREDTLQLKLFDESNNVDKQHFTLTKIMFRLIIENQ